VQAGVEEEIEAELASSDYAAAWQTFEQELDPRLLQRTGFRGEELEVRGVVMKTWMVSLYEELVAATSTAIEDLRVAVEGWQRELEREVEELRVEHRWRTARAQLPSRDREILEGAHFGSYQFPFEELERELVDVRSRISILRRHIEDDWVLADRDLRRWVDERADTLAAELEARELRRGAAAELHESFRHELKARRLDRDEMITEVARSSLDRLESRADDLDELEDRLMKREMLKLVADTEEETAFFLSKREYEHVVGLWEEVGRMLEASAGELSDWRAELGEPLALRSAEAEMLLGLLRRVADRVLRLDGQQTDLWVGSILRSGVRVEAGADPLAQGFRIEDAGEMLQLDLRSLRSSDFEALAGLPDEARLSADDRLLLALFRYHEGRSAAARKALRSGELPAGGLSGELVGELTNRVLDAIEHEGRRRKDREADAGMLLARTLSADRAGRSPDIDVHRINTLLGQYRDTEVVKANRRRLVDLRDRLMDPSSRASEEVFRSVFRPDGFEFLRLSRVRMSFSFAAQEAGAWEPGDWVFDGVGWTHRGDVPMWSDLVAQRGPRLVLKQPLDADKSYFEVELTIDQLEESGPPRLLLLSVGGFHVAFCGPALPGSDGWPRLLMGVEGIEDFVARVREGEAEKMLNLLEPGARHKIVLTGYRRSGYFDLSLDGRSLSRAHLGIPIPEDRSVVVRSWEPVRLVEASVEAKR
jgi:hypothetical protein